MPRYLCHAEVALRTLAWTGENRTDGRICQELRLDKCNRREKPQYDRITST
jgi:hypothetical protein